MRITNLSVLLGFLLPGASFAASDGFVAAAQLLSAAKNSDARQIEILLNSGADINYIDSTGVSLVCTALMNRDTRTAQILQMYGADASNCDRQIKQYKAKGKTGADSGFFGGLSTAQGLALTAAGAVAVIGGLYMLTDVFEPDDDNSSSSGGGSGNGSGNDNPNTTNGEKMFAGGLPYGPLLINATAENGTYATNLGMYNPSDTSEIFHKNFVAMSANGMQNYLLLMHGYSPFARGYMGMRTLRNTDYSPVNISSQDTYGSQQIGGGRPVNVALVTANGINAAEGTSLENKYLVWSGLSLTPSVNTVSSKYYNNSLTVDGADEYSVVENASFDLSGSGTAINNSLATDLDNFLAKVVGGDTSVQINGDFVGFMPNGQMTIYRTGAGTVMTDLETPQASGTYSFETLTTGEHLGLLGDDWVATVNSGSVVLTSETDSSKVRRGYIGADGLLYLDSSDDGSINAAYSMDAGVFYLVKQSSAGNYYNYSAMVDAANRSTASSDMVSGGQSKVDVIANLDVIDALHNLDANTITDVLSYSSANYKSAFETMVNSAYGNVDFNGLSSGANATAFFGNLGGNYAPLVVFSTGGSKTDSAYSGRTYEATFENAAPLIYGYSGGVSRLEHLFMSVVAVGAGTSGQGINANSDAIQSSGQYHLAQWQIGDNYYKARVCGAAGQGANGLDPWCFAAAGMTDEAAAAAAAGAAGVLRSAFYYMTPQQVYMLLALTADGPFLKTNTNGQVLDDTALLGHLQSLYVLPNEYQIRVNSGENYFDVFKEVFGYGVINLERATKPGTNLYYYSSGKIISSPNNAYWRAASNTSLRGSAALNLGRVALNTVAYDVLESADGSMSLPRVWENTVEFGGVSRHELYMGDVLSDLRVRDSKMPTQKLGDITFGLARSERSYDDGMGGLDNLRLEYAGQDWKFGADYQRYLTDGESRFVGMSNPVLAMTSNAITTDFEYGTENWAFGGRAFSGAVTDEGLLESDPAISSNYVPLRLGQMFGAESNIGWKSDKFGVKTSFGMAHETNTILGAAAKGLVSFGASDTMYVDSELYWKPSDKLRLRLHGTFARTNPGAGDFGLVSVSDLYSNAFGADAMFGNLSFGIMAPLAVNAGHLNYSYTNYEIVEGQSGHYDLTLTDVAKSIDIATNTREIRLDATYRHNFGEFTDGAVGFIYRINPN
nr:hypothetical protein [Alphaproteobacteria bacterium]